MSTAARVNEAHRSAMEAHKKAAKRAREEALREHSQGSAVIDPSAVVGLSEALGGDDG